MKRLRRAQVDRWALAVVLLSAFFCTVGADDLAQSLFEEANLSYQNGDHQRALDQYTEILGRGYQSGALYFNLGNCHFKLGNLGRAVLNYERALRFMPGDEAVLANLELTRSLVADEIVPLPEFLPLQLFRSWLSLFSRPWLARLSAVFYVSALSAVAVRILSRSRRMILSSLRLASCFGLLTLVFTLTLVAVEWDVFGRTEAVILADEAPVMSAPEDDPDLTLFTIHEGTKVRIDQQAGEWAEVVLADGKLGWVRQSAFEII